MSVCDPNPTMCIKFPSVDRTAEILRWKAYFHNEKEAAAREAAVVRRQSQVLTGSQLSQIVSSLPPIDASPPCRLCKKSRDECSCDLIPKPSHDISLGDFTSKGGLRVCGELELTEPLYLPIGASAGTTSPLTLSPRPTPRRGKVQPPPAMNLSLHDILAATPARELMFDALMQELSQQANELSGEINAKAWKCALDRLGEDPRTCGLTPRRLPTQSSGPMSARQPRVLRHVAAKEPLTPRVEKFFCVSEVGSTAAAEAFTALGGERRGFIYARDVREALNELIFHPTKSDSVLKQCFEMFSRRDMRTIVNKVDLDARRFARTERDGCTRAMTVALTRAIKQTIREGTDRRQFLSLEEFKKYFRGEEGTLAPELVVAFLPKLLELFPETATSVKLRGVDGNEGMKRKRSKGSYGAMRHTHLVRLV